MNANLCFKKLLEYLRSEFGHSPVVYRLLVKMLYKQGELMSCLEKVTHQRYEHCHTEAVISVTFGGYLK